MRPEDILFIVPVKESLHALYLRDGRVVTITTYNGAVQHVSRLPQEAEIEKLENKPRGATVVPFST